MPHSERQITMFLGALHGGFVPSILAWPTARMDAEKYARNVREALPREGTRFWLRPLFYVAAAELIFMFDPSNTAFIYFQF